MRRIPRQLDPLEIRVLGALLEKEQTTPDLYPLTVNALLSACNQRSNRDPVMDAGEEEVRTALGGLIHEMLVWRTEGARSTRWRHNLDDRWQLDGRRKAVITELLLRGPQTVGELRSRCSRMMPLEDAREVREILEELAAPPEPLVAEMPREPGQKGTRWGHRLGCTEAVPTAGAQSAGSRGEGSGSRDDGISAGDAGAAAAVDVVAELEQRIRELERRVEALEGRRSE